MPTGEKILRWVPRLLSLAFVLFLSLFALDVFSEYPGAEAILPLLIHLIPSFALLAAVLAAWRYEWIGGLVFLGFAAWYVWEAGPGRPWSWYALIAGPAALTGALFFASWLRRRSGFASEDPERATTR